MPDIFPHTGDANLRMNNESSWSAARDAAVAEVIDTSGDKYSAAIREKANSGGTQYSIRRYFAAFDTSGISVKPESATFKLHGYLNSDSQIVVVKVSAGATGDSSTNFVAADYNNVTSTKYSDEYDGTFSTSEYNLITLNDAALSDIASLDEFKIAVIGHDFDYSNETPANNVSRATGFYTANASGGNAGKRPVISYSEGTASEDNREVLRRKRKKRTKGGSGKGFSTTRVQAPSSGGKTVTNGFKTSGF
tara:strand:+ start:482 stop:1231 length:750 start_codon:yes stop_codon:yes gene_type:complete